MAADSVPSPGVAGVVCEAGVVGFVDAVGERLFAAHENEGTEGDETRDEENCDDEAQRGVRLFVVRAEVTGFAVVEDDADGVVVQVLASEEGAAGR